MRTNNRAEMYYTYAYLREDGTPYYIGKGKGDRAYRKDGKPCATPKDKSKIIQLKTNLTEEEAFNHERYMIFILGRKDLGTGILLNKSDGGEGASGCIPSEKTRIKISEKNKLNRLGEKNSFYGRKHTEETKQKMKEAAKRRKEKGD